MVNTVVLVKLAVDVGQLRIDPSTGRPLIDEAPLKISDIDRMAIEEAVRIKERYGGKITSISVLTWGPISKRASEAEMPLREALAMGVDEAILIADERLLQADTKTTANVIAGAIRKMGNVDLIIAGEGTIDGFSGVVGSRVSMELNIPLITYARKIELKGNILTAERDLEDYVEVVETTIPAIVTVTREINVPRLPTLLQIRMAVKKPLRRIGLSEIGVEVDPKVKPFMVEGVKVRRKNIMVEGKTPEELVENLIRKMVDEGIIVPKR